MAIGWWTSHKLRSKNSRTRVEAIHDLRKDPSREASDALITALQDPDFTVRDNAIEALVDRREPHGTSVVVERLLKAMQCKDGDALERMRAVERLGRTGETRAIPQLVVALAEGDHHAKSALDRLDRNWSTTQLAKTGMELFLKRVDSGQVPTKYLVPTLRGMDQLGAAPNMVVVLKLLQSPSEEIAAAALTRLSQLLSDHEDWIDRKVVLPTLVSLLCSSNKSVKLRERAAYILKWMSWQPVSPTERVLATIAGHGPVVELGREVTSETREFALLTARSALDSRNEAKTKWAIDVLASFASNDRAVAIVADTLVKPSTVAYELCSMLREILQRDPANLSAESLAAAAGLRAFVTEESYEHDYADGLREGSWEKVYKDREISCSPIHELAKQEIARRAALVAEKGK